METSLTTDQAIDILVKACHANAKNHGFYDDPVQNIGEKIALIHSELSEFLEAYRKSTWRNPDEHCPEFSNGEIELADVCIRVFDLAGFTNMRLGEAITAKHTYNLSRPYKHGKNF